MTEILNGYSQRSLANGTEFDARRGIDTEPTHSSSSRHRWEGVVTRRLLVSDLVVVAATFAVAHLIRFGFTSETVGLGFMDLRYAFFALMLGSAWVIALTLADSRDLRVLGSGSDEYQIIARASVLVFGWVAIFSLLLQWDLSRGYLALVFTIGPLTLVVSRKLWRFWLRLKRRGGEFRRHVLVIGGTTSGKAMAEKFERDLSSGFSVTGVWIPDRQVDALQSIMVDHRTVPVFGTELSLNDVVKVARVDVVAVTDTEHLGHAGMRELGWSLDALDIDLLVSPNVVDVAGPRLHMRAVANMPFVHLERPRYAGASGFGKALFDRLFALTGILVLSPVLIAAAIAVKCSSRGPIFYRSERIGIKETAFGMLKFRSMKVGADDDVLSMLDQNDGAGPLFKMRDDPRVTRVGKTLRRFSIDELPQLFNVLKGEMSIVGPRPPLRREVDLYEHSARRRLLVRQGMTGLWQVSGRSDLPWDESVRLDLDYVENWSMIRDLQIIWRTARAVIRPDGAY